MELFGYWREANFVENILFEKLTLYTVGKQNVTL
jgi:hypothetical protein